MYLIAIHVPIHLDGPNTYLATDWLKSVRLLRDSLEDRYGPVTIAAPSRPYAPEETPQKLEKVVESEEGIRLIPSFDNRCRSREYWIRHRKQWREQLRGAVKDATVVHAALDDVFRPISYEGFLEARRQGRATVFVQDTDIALQTRQLNADKTMTHRIRAAAYSRVFESLCRNAVATANLSMLKGTRLMKRYAPYQRNARLFHDTSISCDDIADRQLVESRCNRLADWQAGIPLRLVYCGRLTPRKGLLDSVEIVAKLVALGVNVRFDIIGEGEQRPVLESKIQEAGLQSHVQMLGRVAYGKPLFEKLQTYHGLLFTPLAEDTPRMIFDAYAAGLPLIGYDIDYIKERDKEDNAVCLLPSRDTIQAANLIASLSANPDRIRALSLSALEAAHYHASENWYRRRAGWTHEAVTKHLAGQEVLG